MELVSAALLFAIRKIFGFGSCSMALSFDRLLYSTATNVYFDCVIKDKEKWLHMHTWLAITVFGAICILLNLSSTIQHTQNIISSKHIAFAGLPPPIHTTNQESDAICGWDECKFSKNIGSLILCFMLYTCQLNRNHFFFFCCHADINSSL